MQSVWSRSQRTPSYGVCSSHLGSCSRLCHLRDGGREGGRRVEGGGGRGRVVGRGNMGKGRD